MHPDHKAVTDIVVNGVFYARLPKWDEVNGAPAMLDGTEPHEIDRLFFARCRMEPAWSSIDFAVDISDVYDRKRAAIAAYASVFQGDQAHLVERYAAEDQYFGSLLGVRYAEPFQARSPLLDQRSDCVCESHHSGDLMTRGCDALALPFRHIDDVARVVRADHASPGRTGLHSVVQIRLSQPFPLRQAKSSRKATSACTSLAVLA